ncbi:energy-coupling factor ABC transporter substrate-binding protein [Streptomyces thermolilacinus]
MSRNARINVLLVLVVVALAVLPLALGLGEGKEEPFAGADAQAETAITENAPDYEPWFTPLYEPPSGEVESALFSLQAALGAGVLAYYFGLRRGRRQGEERARGATVSEGATGAEAGGVDAGAAESGAVPAGGTGGAAGQAGAGAHRSSASGE